jgi:hypothetical protein
VQFSEPMRTTQDGFGPAASGNVVANYSLARVDLQPVTARGGGPISITSTPLKPGGQRSGTGNLQRLEGSRVPLNLDGLLAPGDYLLAIASTVADDAGNPLGVTSLPFTIPATTPALTVTAVSTQTQLYVSFSSEVAATSTHASLSTSYRSATPGDALATALATMTESSRGNAARAALYTDVGAWGPTSLDGRGVTFRFASALVPGTYTLIVSGVSDDFGNLMPDQPIQVVVE